MGGLFIIALLALVAGVGIVALIETEPGYLLIAYGGYTVETSFWVGILLIATVVLLLYASLRFLHRLITSPANVLNWAGERRLRQSARLTSRGIINFIEGSWAKSRKQMLRGARYSESPLLNYLMAARASYRLQEPEAMRQHLVKAAESDLEAIIAVDLTQAELQLNDRQYEKALRTLEAAKKNPNKHPQVLSLLCKAYDGLGDIEAMLTLLPALRKYRIGGALELDDLEARIHHDLLEQAAVTGDAALLKARWKKYPARLLDDESVQLHYLSSLLVCDEVSTLEREIEKRLKKSWKAALVSLYGRIPRESAPKQLATAESWLKQHANDPELLLCLGRLAMVERQWAKARDYLERSHAALPSEEACLELGRLLTAVGDHSTAAEVFRVGTGLRTNPLPELPQPDDVVADSLPETHRIESP
ncbi:heme biosynthesis HemY N-terminal domain-containing protein [Congregibacter sp.]|uniref:heme biosynthesis HemY N-terminal domain-containing protein n=1 Tax=Congregibacter sp. TaxID=2744308 RepID=UPI003F6AA7CB